MEKEKHQLRLDVMKKKPKPNAPKYILRTVEDIFNTVTQENYKRFLKDLKGSIEVTLAMRKAINGINEREHGKTDPLPVTQLEWIDD